MTSHGADALHTTPYQLQERIVAWEKRARDAEEDAIAMLFLLAEIRNAVGDADGRLMQDELVARIRALHQERDALELNLSCDSSTE